MVDDASRGGMPPRNGKGMKPWKKYTLLGVAALVLIGLVFFAISWSKRGVVSVQTAKVGRQDIASVVTASGEIKPPPEDLANVNANSMGKIVELLVKEGDRVKKGQLLLRTEDVQQNADVDAMAAGLSTEKADVSQAQAAVESLARALANETAAEDQPEAARQDQLEAARALAVAQLELKRIREAKVAATPTGLDQMLDPGVLTGLCAIGRYERLALSWRKAAKRRLDEIEDGLG